MKLADIKKLKVPELRSKLQELGLDTKGLKAELVSRLWSASEARQSQEDGGEELKRQNDNIVHDDSSPIQSETQAPVSAPPRSEAGSSAPSKIDSTTQTDTETTDPDRQTEEEMRPGTDRRARPSEERGRGRAFYEFKEEIRYKRAKSPQTPVSGELTEGEDEDKVRLNIYDSHLHFEVGPDSSCGQPRFWDRFPLLWSGCRLTHGVLQGRVGFEVRVERTLLNTQLEEQDGIYPHGLRVGWSVANTSLLLGEDKFSFSYDGRGVKMSGGIEEQFGEPFSVGDIIGCYISFSPGAAVEITFLKNGRFMGVAFSLSNTVLLGRPLFPHVLCKSCSVRFHLDPTAPPWYPGHTGFTPLAALAAGQTVRTTLAPSSPAQCEVLMMVGLPGSGKSHWARTHMRQYPDKQYRLLGTEELLACMISGGQREHQLQQASQCLTDLIKLAAQTPGNYILDQCNILFSARRYKLQLFAGYRRQVVVIFPSADEWKRRLSRHQTSGREQIPETALLKLQASCSLPEQEKDLLEELQYVELPQEQAQELLKEYKDEAHRLLPPVPKQEKKKRRLYRKRPHPHGPLPAYKAPWTGLYGWNDTRLNMQMWRQQPEYWNVSYQDHGYYYRDFGAGGYGSFW